MRSRSIQARRAPPRARRALALTLLLLGAGCGGAAPTPATLVRAHGASGARDQLRLRLASRPSDATSRRALIALELELGHPGAALAHLEVLAAAGAPLGDGLQATDRRRLGTLLLARSTIRTARLAASALDDVDRASRLGVEPSPELRRGAVLARALSELRHADPGQRARGQRRLRELAAQDPIAATDPAVRGAAAQAGLDDVAALGAWLWDRQARRAAYLALEAWAARGGRGGLGADRWARARRWWRAEPELAATEPCPFVGSDGSPGCTVVAAAEDSALDGPGWEADLVRSARAWPPARDVAQAEAWVLVAMRAFLRGELPSWHGELAARIDLPAVLDDLEAIDPALRSPLLRAAGRREQADRALASALRRAPGRLVYRLVLATEAAMAGRTRRDVEQAWRGLEATAVAAALVARFDGGAMAAPTEFARIAATFAAARAGAGASTDSLTAMAVGYQRDPALADRLADEFVAGQVDLGAASAAVAWLFDALGDRARTRARWQAAVDASPEPAALAELALACARAGDAPAALLHLTAAAAASGDPAVVLLRGAHTLLASDLAVDALAVARQALELAGPDEQGAAHDVAIAAARVLGRAELADELARQRLGWRRDAVVPGDPTDPTAALAATSPPAVALAGLVVAARWNPRDHQVRAAIIAATAPDDPRHQRAWNELAAIAVDRDPDLARAAVVALRRLALR
ncbi:MAG: hypothetical protein KA297_26140 [Kofleriaceae bacterium]|nr:hypothetical protein [Kofleriaceae bacterium]